MNLSSWKHGLLNQKKLASFRRSRGIGILNLVEVSTALVEVLVTRGHLLCRGSRCEDHQSEERNE